MKFEIKNRFTGKVQITADIECADDALYSVKLGLAVKWAVKSRADLSETDLSLANLSRAYLSRAYLSETNLSRAYLSETNLSGANLSGANLSETDLSETDLSLANLSRANLSGAYLSETNLSGANLSCADLSCANLSRADLSCADLSGADLLAFGNMREIKTLQFDKWAIGYSADTLQIGCQSHPIKKWRKWRTEAGRKWVAKMDKDALEWADRNLDLVLSIIDTNPATPTGKETGHE